MKKVKEIRSMTRDEVKEAVDRFPVAILPLGATEQHGHHLPLGVDVMLAEGIARLVAEKTGALLLPAMPFGYSWVWRDISGTISLQQHNVEAIIKDVAHSVSRYGIELLVLINGHEANNSSMKYAARELEDELSMPVIYLFYPDLSEVMEEYCDSETWHGMVHACELETSLMLAMYPEHVRMERAVKEYPERPSLYGRLTISLGDLSESGIYGDPTRATEEKGKRMLDAFVKIMSENVKEAYALIQKEKARRRGEQRDSKKP
jgi:creatinine amidohydrolase